MPRIVTITFNPCIDKSSTVAALIPEKKLKCTTPVFEPGGGGINVARAIRKLGGDVTAIFPEGGYSGKFLSQLLKNEKVDVIEIETINHTRENLIIFDASTNQQYRFGMPGQVQTEKEWTKCLQELRELEAEYIIASGSLAPGVPTDIFGRIAEIAKKKKAKLIVDTTGEALKHAIEKGIYLFKPNLGELAKLAGDEEMELENITSSARKIIQDGGSEVVVVSMGAAGARLVTADESIQFLAPPVKCRSTVGAGDSMVAGIVLSLANGKNLTEAVRYGVACGTAATLNPGTQLCRLEDVEKLYQSVCLF